MVSDAPLTRICYVRVEQWPTGSRYTVISVADIADRTTEKTHSCHDAAEALQFVAEFLHPKD
jgi:hypothetical protein